VYFQSNQINYAIQTWQKTSSDSPTYEASLLNAVLVMGQNDFKTKSLELLESKKFTTLSEDQIKNIKELISIQKNRVPANFDYQTKVVEPLSKYMNLGWE
jgi:hypothetical protein